MKEVQGLADVANNARAAGQSTADTARMLVKMRNQLKLTFRALSPPEAVKAFEARNIAKYGNPLGPTADQLRAAGKTWDQIIEAASRPGGKDLGL